MKEFQELKVGDKLYKHVYSESEEFPKLSGIIPKEILEVTDLGNVMGFVLADKDGKAMPKIIFLDKNQRWEQVKGSLSVWSTEDKKERYAEMLKLKGE